MERTNRLVGERDQDTAANDPVEQQATGDLRILADFELVLAGGGEHGVEWP